MNNDSVPAGQRGFLFFDLIGPTIPKEPVLAWEYASKEQLLVGRGSAGGDLLFKLLPVYWGPTVDKGQPAFAELPLQRGCQTVFNADANKLVGTHTLRPKGFGATTIQLSPDQDFLERPQVEPISVDPSKGFEVRWTPVARAVGYTVSVIDDETIWLSSRQNWLALGSTEALRTGVLLKASHCSVPSGILHGCVTVTVSAVSKEAYGSGSLAAVGWAESRTTVQSRYD